MLVLNELEVFWISLSNGMLLAYLVLSRIQLNIARNDLRVERFKRSYYEAEQKQLTAENNKLRLQAIQSMVKKPQNK